MLSALCGQSGPRWGGAFHDTPSIHPCRLESPVPGSTIMEGSTPPRASVPTYSQALLAILSKKRFFKKLFRVVDIDLQLLAQLVDGLEFLFFPQFAVKFYRDVLAVEVFREV